ncbi:MAG TPA: class I SAM-dependent methyltransferase, partial [Marinagarivorans sp.]|nr:class I SAM-dependent methyltransferase [Marinagarivorans sp.]
THNTPPKILDLGAGTGANLRALYKPNQSWRLVDWDNTLLNEALRRHPQYYVTTHKANLNALESLPWDGVTAVTASALFDLTSAQFIDQLVAQLAERKLTLYSTLNYEGSMRWLPAHPLDASVERYFNSDQRRDKGFGPALGPDACAYLSQCLTAHGYNVILAESPWQLGQSQRALSVQLIAGIYRALKEQPLNEAAQLHPTALAHWRQFRLEHLFNSACYVGHMDLLALPPE